MYAWRPDDLGDAGVAPVRTDDDAGTLYCGLSVRVVAADADDRPVLDDELIDGESFANLGAGGGGRVDQDLVEQRSPWRQADRTAVAAFVWCR